MARSLLRSITVTCPLPGQRVRNTESFNEIHSDTIIGWWTVGGRPSPARVAWPSAAPPCLLACQESCRRCAWPCHPPEHAYPRLRRVKACHSSASTQAFFVYKIAVESSCIIGDATVEFGLTRAEDSEAPCGAIPAGRVWIGWRAHRGGARCLFLELLVGKVSGMLMASNEGYVWVPPAWHRRRAGWRLTGGRTQSNGFEQERISAARRRLGWGRLARPVGHRFPTGESTGCKPVLQGVRRKGVVLRKQCQDLGKTCGVRWCRVDATRRPWALFLRFPREAPVSFLSSYDRCG